MQNPHGLPAPRHCHHFSGPSVETSALTGAPTALARSLGIRLATKGTVVAAAATPPATGWRLPDAAAAGLAGSCHLYAF